MELDGRKLLTVGSVFVSTVMCGLPGLAMCSISASSTFAFLVDSYTLNEYINGAISIGLFFCCGSIGIIIPIAVLYFVRFKTRIPAEEKTWQL